MRNPVAKTSPKRRQAGADRDRHAARTLIAATRAAFDAFDREVATSRQRAERVLADLERWAAGGPVPSYARRYFAACEGDDREENEWLYAEFLTAFNLHDAPLTALADLAVDGRVNRERYLKLLTAHVRDAFGTHSAIERVTAAVNAGAANA